jgi:AmmeMemoRadiSam system protein A
MNKQQVLGATDAHLCCYYTSAHLNRARQAKPTEIDITQLFQSVPDEQGQESVSYVGLVLAKPAKKPLQDLLTGYEKKSLLAMVKNVIVSDLAPEADKKPDHLLAPIISSNLDVHIGAFVTLHKQGQLRGCIGNIISPQPLYKTVMAMARAAACNDTRFNPVTSDEVNQLAIDITILSEPTHVNSYRDIVLGKHGIILQKYDIQGRMTNSSVFLPQVPLGQGWDLNTTLEQLSLKAGLGRTSWTERCSFDVFEGFEITWNS